MENSLSCSQQSLVPVVSSTWLPEQGQTTPTDMLTQKGESHKASMLDKENAYF